jgi:hypothetical protein
MEILPVSAGVEFAPDQFLYPIQQQFALMRIVLIGLLNLKRHIFENIKIK